MEAHCHRSTYALQLCKCLRDTCAYCLTHLLRMSMKEFNSLCYLPLPILDSTMQHYKPFKDLYSQLPNERDRPSLAFWWRRSGQGQSQTSFIIRKGQSSSDMWRVLQAQMCLLRSRIDSERKGYALWAWMQLHLWKCPFPTNFTIPFIHCYSSKPYLSWLCWGTVLPWSNSIQCAPTVVGLKKC